MLYICKQCEVLLRKLSRKEERGIMGGLAIYIYIYIFFFFFFLS